MDTNKRFDEIKKFADLEKAARRRQIREVKIYMKKIFNPMYYDTKPRYRKELTSDEQAFVKTAVKNVYNPKIRSRNNVFDELSKELQKSKAAAKA